ncbi:hypothetical protein [Ewingella americana]|uniref:Uncharacterized protein n=1 Tax=Ewingella americana TaxID=41202 RepID=A0A502GE78_9GAMM|nr:hypothetical protein [Ewingella americana]TPG60041.1 hypothetical protein EAH77_15855 [Ewingella americana]
MPFLDYLDTRFIRRSVSGDFAKHYNEVRKSAGIFAITNDMVDTFGTSKTYIEDLVNTVKDPYTDFRFNNKLAYQFLVDNCPDLTFIDSRIKDLATAYAMYFGVKPVQTAINKLADKFLDDDLTILLARFGSYVSSETDDQYALIQITNLRHTYLTDLARKN